VAGGWIWPAERRRQSQGTLCLRRPASQPLNAYSRTYGAGQWVYLWIRGHDLVWLESSRPRNSPLARFLPLPSADPNPLPPVGGGGSSSLPSISSSELWEAQARSRVPSTEKCYELSSSLTRQQTSQRVYCSKICTIRR
jgi:hypothetical protein